MEVLLLGTEMMGSRTSCSLGVAEAWDSCASTAGVGKRMLEKAKLLYSAVGGKV